MNRNKSLLFIPISADALTSLLPDDIPITRKGFTLLGCPIGPPAYCDAVLQGRVDKMKGTLSVLHDMGEFQVETTLLRTCLAMP